MRPLCLVLTLAACAAQPLPAPEPVTPIEVPTALRTPCLNTADLPAPPRLPRTPESIVRWAEAVRTAATKALIVCDRKRQDLVELIEHRNAQQTLP